MANTYHMVNIDSDKLRAELSKRALVSEEVSCNIGFCKAYISKTLAKGRCNRTTVALLEQKYGILPDSYVVSYSSDYPYKEVHTNSRVEDSRFPSLTTITEEELKKIVSETVERVLREIRH